jgi:serine/threonine protein kinase
VHRDIKPANIHIGRLGLEHDFVKVLDFGLVKPVAGPTDEHSLATAAGVTPGTPSYMAPEVALGETVDGRADLYALGCVAYYLLTGALVFEAESGVQMIAKHLRAEPVPPSRRAAQPIPAELERLVLACLAKQPGDRPRSAEALAQALEHVEVAPWDEVQAMQWWSDHPVSFRPQLLEPVQHHIDPRPGQRRRPLEHEEPLSVARDIVAPQPGPPRTVRVRSGEQRHRLTALPILQIHRHRHHAVTLAEHQLPPAPGPHRLRPTGRRNFPATDARIGK